MHAETGYKFCKFYENRARVTPLQGVYIAHFDQILVKNFRFGGPIPNRCTDRGEIWHGLPPCQISPPSVQCVTPVGRKNLKINL